MDLPKSSTPTPTITTTSADVASSIPSFAAARRARADTLPSRPTHRFLDSPAGLPVGSKAHGINRPLRRTPSLLVPPQLSTRHRSGSLTLPSASISAAFGPSIFTSSWGDPDSPSDRPATTPTTREMLFDSENENSIMSTLDALGLDDPQSNDVPESNSSKHSHSHSLSLSGINSSSLNGTSVSSIGSHRPGIDLRSRSASFATTGLSHHHHLDITPSPSLLGSNSVNGSMPDIRLEKSLAHSLLMPGSVSFANRIRSYSVSATPAYQEVLEDEHEDDIGQLNSSSPSSGSAGIYSGSAGGVHQFQTFQTHSRPRAISMGFLEIPNDIADEQRKFANAGPRSYSDMKARQTHQRTTSAGADMLSDLVNGISSDKSGLNNNDLSNTNGNINGTTTGNNSSGTHNPTHSHSHSLSHSHSHNQLRALHTQHGLFRPGHGHSSSFSGRGLADDVTFGETQSLTNGVTEAQSHGDNVPTEATTPPFQDGASSGVTQQVPTRSLWIGNVDPNFTTNELMQIFSPFGPVESLKVIPDKECAFVNFMRVEDAMRAKEDISERRGGRIGNATVRVGYGKAELMASADAPVLHPTRALWIGNIPASTTPAALQAMFGHFGAIESARVLTHKSCGFINFEHMDDAVLAKKVMHGQEAFGPGTGAVRIGFAKVPAKQSPSDSPLPGDQGEMNGDLKSSGSLHRNRQDSDEPTELDRMLALVTMASKNQASSIVGEREAPIDPAFERIAMLQEFNADPDNEPIPEVPGSLTEPVTYFATIPAVAEPSPHRRLDAPRLREIRKRLDSGHCTVKELDNLSNECMDECVELCSDYIGNTVMQKLFERCSEPQKTKMLELIAPHLASIGVHKNGTWAAQKIIECAKSPAQTELICKYVRPYTPPLLLDQFGNYVVQCCLRLGQTRNGFIFEAMADKFWDIAQGRFGARAMRASLESQHASKRQQKQVAVAIVQNALALATNPNGTLMLTWLLDNSQLSGRYRVLAPRLAPHMATLATHKLASLTILKVISQRQEPDASDILIKSIVNSPKDQVLEEILGDQVHGVSLTQKILASPNVEQQQKQVLAEKVKAVLAKVGGQSAQGCKRLLEEINLILGGDGSSPSEQHSKMATTASNFSQQDFQSSTASFYASLNASQLHGQPMTPESASNLDMMDSATAQLSTSTSVLTPSTMTHGGFSLQHSPYYGMPHGQMYAHYPGQMAPYYGGGAAYIPPMGSMGYHPGMMAQSGYNPYVAGPPPGISAHPGQSEGSQLGNSAQFLQQQQQQQQQMYMQQHHHHHQFQQQQ
ncbi:hypothetical protein BGZ93_004924 [Podila epicladia]|nr:hypothetical protein BGZ93_004924 [Podila epicladia]